jgi:hypothetical protein
VLVDIVEDCLDSRAVRFPNAVKRRSSTGKGLAAWPPTAPLFVGSDGDRITRGTLQYRVLRAFRHAGIDGDRARVRWFTGYVTRSPPSCQRRRQRLLTDEASGPRVHGHFTAVLPLRELKPAPLQLRTGSTDYSNSMTSSFLCLKTFVSQAVRKRRSFMLREVNYSVSVITLCCHAIHVRSHLIWQVLNMNRHVTDCAIESPCSRTISHLRRPCRYLRCWPALSRVAVDRPSADEYAECAYSTAVRRRRRTAPTWHQRTEWSLPRAVSDRLPNLQQLNMQGYR